MRDIRPTGNRLLIKLEDYTPKAESKLALPDSMKHPTENRGCILAWGELVPDDLKKLHLRVYFHKAGINLFTENDKKLMLVEASEIWAVEEKWEPGE